MDSLAPKSSTEYVCRGRAWQPSLFPGTSTVPKMLVHYWQIILPTYRLRAGLSLLVFSDCLSSPLWSCREAALAIENWPFGICLRLQTARGHTGTSVVASSKAVCFWLWCEIVSKAPHAGPCSSPSLVYPVNTQSKLQLHILILRTRIVFHLSQHHGLAYRVLDDICTWLDTEERGAIVSRRWGSVASDQLPAALLLPTV